MTRSRIVLGILFAAAVLPAATVWAADPPEVTQRKRELSQAYTVSHTYGICQVFISLKGWQRTNWPEGKPVVEQFLNEKLLPRFASDPEALKGKLPVQIEIEFLQFCKQSQDQAFQVLDSLQSAGGAADSPQPPAAEAEYKLQVRDSMLAATFLGQCQTAGELHFGFDAKPEHKEKLEQFVKNEIYAKDPKYRQVELSTQDKIDDYKAAIAAREANDAKELQYARDCDTVTAKFNEISEQLKETP